MWAETVDPKDSCSLKYLYSNLNCLTSWCNARNCEYLFSILKNFLLVDASIWYAKYGREDDETGAEEDEEVDEVTEGLKGAESKD